ncbi:cyclodeaminase/cyclohydrolase family protein [Glycomyces algeriensis]|uniref:Formiminotransferase-cyclodeaminase n=1 Tax=Glycomyces algeriensis TaxID=256037 RepID=A0A9W6G939_9ACTN|nr:cyclodeaminase/cyclohydrolase family protein [Glycomyces algeriensis]MDA1365187.1 cyclodeaminase/cyclohydrolase family protein [Glycomyces algeriensis]MDR7349749.1 formiminotetrahydrofolate cyclodeaminase [Glycomyces algeriensis]GLI42458.1 formiminotransferase-cyclodeaminase [Glycomyces algeriensis]
MRETTIDDWLTDLASELPAPGGGAAAGMSAAMAAALVSMVCNLTIGKPKFAEHEAVMREALADAERLRGAALQLAEDDAEAFSGVVAAYKLPKSSDEEKAARTAAIQAGLVEAAAVPLAVAKVSAEVIKLSGRVLEGSNPNVLSDVAVAASAAKSALESAALNVDINVVAIKDPAERERLASTLNEALQAKVQAEAIMQIVAKRIRA